jgi:hypothetical protein
MFRRLFLSFAVLVVALAVAIPSWIATHETDLASPNDSDLAIGLREGERNTSGFEAAARAAGLLVWADDADERIAAIRSGSGDPRWLARLVASNGPAFRALETASEIDMETAAREQDVAEVHRASLKLVNLSGAAARLSARRGDAAAAVDQAMFGMRLGRELTRSAGGNLVGMMFAEAYQTRSLEDVEAIVRELELSPTATRQLIEALAASRWRPMDWHRAWAFEYQHMKQVITSIDPQAELENATGEAGVEAATYGLLPAGYLWQPNRTLSKTAATYRVRQRRSVVACSPQREPEAGQGRLAALAASLRPNAIGNILLEVARPSFDRYEEKRCHLEARVSLVQTLAAMKGYWLEHGRLPRSLSALVSQWLPEMPADSFRDAPLQYSAASRRVWSLGADFKTAAEASTPDPADPFEPAVSVAF